MKKKKVYRVIAVILTLSLLAGGNMLTVFAAAPSQIAEGPGGSRLNGNPLTDDVKVAGPGGAPTDLNIGKTLEDTDVENEFIITLEVQTEKALTEIIKPVSAAMVVIIDNSGTMWQDIYGPPYDSPVKTPGGNNALDHAKAAAEHFVESFAVAGVPDGMLDGSPASSYGFVRDIAVIEFSLGAEACWPLDDALEDKGGGASGAIDAIYGKGGTNLAAAIRLARNMLLDRGYGAEVEKHVVILTDGAPNRDFRIGGTRVPADSAEGTALYKSMDKRGVLAPHETAATYSPYGSIIGPADDRPDGQRTIYGGRSSPYSTANNIYKPLSFPVGHPITVTSQDYAVGTDAALEERGILITSFPHVIIHSIYCRTGDGSDVGGDVLLEKHIVYNGGIYSYSEDIWEDFHTVIDFFDDITSLVEQETNLWSVRDELGEHVVFLGPADDSPIFLEEEDGRQYAVWDVYNTSYHEKDDKYYYTASFRVRVDNTDSEFILKYSGDYEIDTNVETTLEYFFEPDGDGGVPSHKQALRFHHKSGGSDPVNDGRIGVPRVKTFTADLEFTKLYNDGLTPLPQVTFELILDPPEDAKGISRYLAAATSGADGRFAFTRIPSGHTYAMVEVVSGDEEGEAGVRIKIADVEIAYGKINIIHVADPGYASFRGGGSSYAIVNEKAEAPEGPEETEGPEGPEESKEPEGAPVTGGTLNNNNNEEELTVAERQRDESQPRVDEEKDEEQPQGGEGDEGENPPPTDLTETELSFTPGGTNPNVRPNPNVPGRVLTPDDEGYIEFDENGVPLGRWEWDNDEGMWVFDEFPPLGNLPQTGGDVYGFWLVLIGVSPLGLRLALQTMKRRRGKA